MSDKLIILLPGITMALYFLTGCVFMTRREPWWALMYFAYALANVGIIWASTLTKVHP